MVGCDEWPRFANLPDAEGHPGSVDPAAIASAAITWAQPIAEPSNARNDLPTEADVPQLKLELGEGYVLTGALSGFGWKGLEPDPITAASCAGASGVRVALLDDEDYQGDYGGDVDFVRIQSPVGDTLCARVLLVGLEGIEAGWDLLPHRSDECGIPNGVYDGPRVPVGMDGAGAVGGWGIVTESPHHSVLLAGFLPDDEEMLISYTLGFSVVRNRPDGSPGLCPLLPDELQGAR